MDQPKNHDALIDALFEGRASAEETARQLDQLAGDTAGDELEELAELVDTLARIDPELALPSDTEFRAARRSVLESIAAEQRPVRNRLPRWLPLAAALAAFGIGLVAGRGSTDSPPTLTLTDLVERGAIATASGFPMADTPFRYSNLRLHEADNGLLAVTVDVAAQLDLVRPKDDLLVSDILASSLVNDSSLGTRLKAVRHTGANPRAHRALIAATLGDSDMSVRLKALERLIEQHATTAATQETLLEVIAGEKSVAMRLLAIDAIDDDYLGTDLLDTLETDLADEGTGAVLRRAQLRFDRRDL